MNNNTVAILGAGMVGVACALELQRRGAQVTLIDRSAPGQETSYGNAGVIARSSLMPFNNPGLWRGLPRLMGNQSAQFRYNPSFLLRNPRWALSFLFNTRPRAFRQTTAALDALICLSTKEHLRLLREARALHRLRDNGWLFLYRSASAYQGSELARFTMDDFGVSTETLDPAAINELEPALAPIFERALWIKDTFSVNDPGLVVQAYAERFVRLGGQIVQAKVDGLQALPANRWRVMQADGQHIDYDKVVVALGPWSREFLRQMNIHVPMAFERGYHMHYSMASGPALRRPVYDTGGGYVLSPMERGLRLSTGVELNDCDAPANPVQLGIAEAAAREALPLGERLDDSIWMGSRPTLPDSRPVIGEMPGKHGLWLAFGHQHIGFSTGPGTAAILGALMKGEKPPIDATPFSAHRFISG